MACVIAVLLCDHVSNVLSPENVARYGDYDRMYTTLLTWPDSGDLKPTFQYFNVVDNDFSFEERLNEFDVILLSGARSDSFADTPWIVKLKGILRKVYEETEIKLLGICFGHQILALAVGGRVGRAEAGWELGLRKVQFTGGNLAAIMEVHRDQVLELPDSVEILGSSSKCPIEVYGVQNRVLGIQGHPEFATEVVRNLVEIKQISEEERSAALATFATTQADTAFWHNLILEFIAGTD